MRRLFLLFVLGAILAGCGEDAGAPLPTPLMTPTPPSQSVVIYVLGRAQVPGYSRTSNLTMGAGAFANHKSDPGLSQRLASEGFVHAASAVYAPPPHAVHPTFTDIISDALMFSTSAGASRYFVEEANRINSVPQGGTLDSVGGLPRRNVEDMVAFAASQPPRVGDPVDRAFVALMRTGRVVAEVYARGASPDSTNLDAFQPLVAAEQTLLATPPNG